jgi:hypothetical protein
VVREGVRPEQTRCAPAGRRFAAHCWRVVLENGGRRRDRETPAAAFASDESAGVWVSAFASHGARDASRAQRSIRPNAYACRGRTRWA